MVVVATDIETSVGFDASKFSEEEEDEEAEDEETEGELVGAEKRREMPGTSTPLLSTGGDGAGASRRHRLRRLLAIVMRSSSP